MKVEGLKEIYQPDGMMMLPVYSSDGLLTNQIAVFEILERHEKRTEDQSGNRWFPQILTRQRVIIQEWRGADPKQLEKIGDPREVWIVVPEESKSLPFAPSSKL